MKNYIYIGKENGQETVVEVTMENPEILDGEHEDDCTCKKCDTYCEQWSKYGEHIRTAPRYIVPFEVPKEWKIGQELTEGKDFVKQHQYYTGFPPYTQWENCSEKDYPIYDPMEKRIVAKPLSIEKETKKKDNEEIRFYAKSPEIELPKTKGDMLKLLRMHASYIMLKMNKVKQGGYSSKDDEAFLNSYGKPIL